MMYWMKKIQIKINRNKRTQPKLKKVMIYHLVDKMKIKQRELLTTLNLHMLMKNHRYFHLYNQKIKVTNLKIEN